MLVFVEGGKPEYLEKSPRSRDENQQQTQRTFNAKCGNRTQATLVGGECSHYCAIPAPHVLYPKISRLVVTGLICAFFQVIDSTPTNSYLDDCLLNQMVEHARKHPNKPRSAEEWILKGSNYHKPTCVSATFDSLVNLRLMEKVPRFFGTSVKYPSLNPGIFIIHV